MSFKPEYKYTINYFDTNTESQQSKSVVCVNKEHLMQYSVEPLEAKGYKILSVYNEANTDKNLYQVK